MRRAWFANLDADRELGTAGSYQTSKRLLAQMRAQRPALAGLLQGELLLDPEQALNAERPTWVLCWCPTPSALSWVQRHGLRAPPAPEMRVLREVNNRAFALSIPGGLPGRTAVLPGEDWSWLSRPPPSGAWRLKRWFGFAGKGQRVLRCPLSADDERWVQDSLKLGGFLCEPQLAVLAEFSIHGYIDAHGLVVGEPCQQWCDAHGQVTRLTRVQAVPALERVLLSAAEVLADHLAQRGYFGPFGMDALSYKGSHGTELSLFSDVNARFSLGWSLGMGELREAALERLEERV